MKPNPAQSIMPDAMLLAMIVEARANCCRTFYYYWISKYFDNDVYHNRGTRWLCANNIPQTSKNGIVDKDEPSDEDAAKLIQSNLIVKAECGYRLNFACFSEMQFEKFTFLFDIEDVHLDDQINQRLRKKREPA